MIASTIGWWAEAGVDTAIVEEARDWLAPIAPEPAQRTAAISAPAASLAATPAAALPDDLATLHRLLAEGAYAPNAAPPRRRVAPSGDPAASLMIITDMPDATDLDAGMLFSGPVAKLFDAILAAIGRTRETIYLAPLSPSRLSGGRIDAVAAAPLAALMRRHIALVRPRAVILFGNDTCRALFGIDRTPGAGGLRSVNHDGGTLAAIATVHPRTMLRHPVCKAEAWADMRLLIGEFAS